jgi:hypothetical protein
MNRNVRSWERVDSRWIRWDPTTSASEIPDRCRCAGPEDVSELHRGGADRCGWCELGVPHTEDEHAAARAFERAAAARRRTS